MTNAYSLINNESFLYNNPDHSMSVEAKWLSALKREIDSDFYSGVMIHNKQKYEIVYNYFAEALVNCIVDNWDGYGAKAISGETLRAAIQFAFILPTTIPVPEISAEPNGDFLFEWYEGPERRLDVIVEDNDNIVFAARIGHRRMHGRDTFGNRLPKMLVESVQDLHTYDQ